MDLLPFLVLLIVTFSSIKGNADEIPSSWSRMEDCKRKCDGNPKICYKKLTVEKYSVLGPACRGCEEGNLTDCSNPQCVTMDGFHRSIITANRQIPSPPLEVCQNDTIIVDVVNQMHDESTSIHWHGIKQTETPWADGVPFVTQCPINPANTFRYVFIAENLGTYFYHSHTGAQKLDGLSGPLIIRGFKNDDLYANLYDEDDHIMMIQDWTHIPAENLSPGLHKNNYDQYPETYVVNGKGAYYDNTKDISLPIKEFEVKSNKRYLFRLIGGMCTACAVSVTFEGHRITLVSSDGDLKFKPVTVDRVVLNSADRFNVILHANQPAGLYYIKLKSLGVKACNRTQYAILRYADSNDTNIKKLPPSSNDLGITFNDIYSVCDNPSESQICMSMLKGVSNAPTIDNEKNYYQIQLELGFFFPSIDHIFKKGTYTSYDEPNKGLLVKGEISNSTFTFPPSPLLTQFNDIPPGAFCGGCTEDLCSCAHYDAVPRNSIVDFIIVHRDRNVAHPFHLHGFNFYVLHTGSNSSEEAITELKERLRTNQIETKSRAMKDTLSTPPTGLSAIRFTADNIGFWLYHCHFHFHLDAGMAGVIKVGNVEELQNQIPKGFPKCGDFLPTLEDALPNKLNLA